jgi:hypothetical protein
LLVLAVAIGYARRSVPCSREGVDVLVSMLTEEEAGELGLQSESEGCGAATIRFVSLPVPDRSVSPDTGG